MDSTYIVTLARFTMSSLISSRTKNESFRAMMRTLIGGGCISELSVRCLELERDREIEEYSLD